MKAEEPSPGRGLRPRPGTALCLLGGGLGVTGAIQVALASTAFDGSAQLLAGSATMMFLLFLAAESTQIHVEIRRHTHSMSFSELPMVLGLFLLPPHWLLGLRLLAAGAVFVARRTAPSKAVFNLGLFTAEVGTAALIFHWLEAGDGLGLRDWGVAYATMVVIGVLGAVAVTAAITLIQGRPSPRNLVRTLLAVTITGVLNTTLALVALLALPFDAAILLLAILLVLLIVAYRMYDRLVRQHADLDQLFNFTQTLAAANAGDDMVKTLLDQARDLLQGETAALHLPRPPDRDGSPTSDSGSTPLSGEPVLIPRNTREPRLRAWLTEVGLRDAVLVPLALDSESAAILQVGNRMGRMSTFTLSDLQLLQTLAAHAGVTWRNGRLLEQARYDAGHDGLTGLANRSLFLLRLQHALASYTSTAPHTVPARCQGAAFLLDLDRFKDINDSLGHHIGDILLQEIAGRLRDHLPPDAVVARLGGDEFGVLLPRCETPQQAVDVANDVRAVLSGPFEVSGTSLEVGVSIGVTLLPQDGREPSTVLQHADIAMYEAKRSALGVVRYHPTDEHGNRRRLTLAAELRRAIDTEQLIAHYQPKMSLANDFIIGYEALARWEHPTRGLLTPDEFIPIAEQTGLITSLTQNILRQALYRCRDWQPQHPGVAIAVNLSTRDLRNRSMHATVAQLLTETGVDPTLLTLEITESSVMGDFTTALAVLEALHDLGVNLSLDDFGTGYSPLTYLQRLPVNEVKIDKSFVTAMNTSTTATAIIRAVIDLAHTLDLTVVAEGVEDEESRRILTVLGCDTMQGYLLSHPLTPRELSHWLDHEARRGHPHARADHRPRLQVIPGHTPGRRELHG